MYYRLSDNYILRGWEGLPFALVEKVGNWYKEPFFMTKEKFMFLLSMNGVEDIDLDSLSEENQKGIEEMLRQDIIHSSEERMEPLSDEQRYHVYPSAYLKDILWSITGKCNYKCRHCLLSAPDGKHPQMSLEACLEVIKDLERCGVYCIDLTGGEPLVRADFMTLIEELSKRHVRIGSIFTNGSMLTEELLDGFEALGQHPVFQVSFDGLGHHSWLRGIENAEEELRTAVDLLYRRGFRYTCAMCMHKGNAESLGATARYLAERGCLNLGLNTPQELGNWREYSEEYALSNDEVWEIYKNYIREYFKDGMPISVQLDGFFHCDKGSTKYSVTYERDYGSEERLSKCRYCESVRHRAYIDAEGRLSPCMGFTDFETIASKLPSVLGGKLGEATGDESFRKIVRTKVSDMVAHNEECQGCEHVLKCGGGCMIQGTTQDGDYLNYDPDVCWFHKNVGGDAVRAVADAAIKEFVDKE